MTKTTAEKKPSAGRAALDKFMKAHSKTAMFASELPNTPRLKTGSLALDFVLNGGIPEGKVVELYGPSGGGKSTLALSIIAEQQRQWELDGNDDYIAVYLDLERSANIEYFLSVGVDTDRLLVIVPDSGEDAINQTREILSTGIAKLIVLDSLAAMVSENEITADAGDSVVAATARINTRFLRIVVGELEKTDSTLIVINQIRDLFNAQSFGPKTKTTGGKATEFFASMRIEIKRIGSLKDRKTNDVVGNKVKMTVEKSRFSPPKRAVETAIIFGKGISKNSELVDLGLQLKVLRKKGNAVVYGEDVIGAGHDAAVDAVAADADLRSRLFVDVEAASDAFIAASKDSENSENSAVGDEYVAAAGDDADSGSEEVPDFV